TLSARIAGFMPPSAIASWILSAPAAKSFAGVTPTFFFSSPNTRRRRSSSTRYAHASKTVCSKGSVTGGGAGSPNAAASVSTASERDGRFTASLRGQCLEDLLCAVGVTRAVRFLQDALADQDCILRLPVGRVVLRVRDVVAPLEVLRGVGVLADLVGLRLRG